jgi:hypothetical protein
MQVTYEIREDFKPLLDAAAFIAPLVMEAGEKQRLHDDLPTDQWVTPNVARYMHHAFMHMVACKTYEASHANPFVLADNTSLYEYWHALVDLLIVAASELKKEAPPGLVIESLGEE